VKVITVHLVIGIDPSERMVQQTRRKPNLGNISYWKASAEALPLRDNRPSEDNRRDTATAVGSHHHQIVLSRRGGIDNCLVDVFVLDVERLAIDTCYLGCS